MVSKHLISAAVEATSIGDTSTDHTYYYRELKRRELRLYSEVKQDIDFFRMVV